MHAYIQIYAVVSERRKELKAKEEFQAKQPSENKQYGRQQNERQTAKLNV